MNVSVAYLQRELQSDISRRTRLICISIKSHCNSRVVVASKQLTHPRVNRSSSTQTAMVTERSCNGKFCRPVATCCSDVHRRKGGVAYARDSAPSRYRCCSRCSRTWTDVPANPSRNRTSSSIKWHFSSSLTWHHLRVLIKRKEKSKHFSATDTFTQLSHFSLSQ